VRRKGVTNRVTASWRPDSGDAVEGLVQRSKVSRDSGELFPGGR
jgi:hypothetical protein